MAGCGGATGCQTDGGWGKTMSKRHRRSQSGREITQAQSNTTLTAPGNEEQRHHNLYLHILQEENTNAFQTFLDTWGQSVAEVESQR